MQNTSTPHSLTTGFGWVRSALGLCKQNLKLFFAIAGFYIFYCGVGAVISRIGNWQTTIFFAVSGNFFQAAVFYRLYKITTGQVSESFFAPIRKHLKSISALTVCSILISFAGSAVQDQRQTTSLFIIIALFAALILVTVAYTVVSIAMWQVVNLNRPVVDAISKGFVALTTKVLSVLGATLYFLMLCLPFLVFLTFVSVGLFVNYQSNEEFMMFGLPIGPYMAITGSLTIISALAVASLSTFVAHVVYQELLTSEAVVI